MVNFNSNVNVSIMCMYLKFFNCCVVIEYDDYQFNVDYDFKYFLFLFNIDIFELF